MRLWKTVTTTLILICAGITVYARLPELIPRKVLFTAPERLAPTLSPDGKRIVYIAPYNGVRNIWLQSVNDDEAKPLTDFRENVIKWAWWATDNKHILFYVVHQKRNETHLYSIDLTRRYPRPENLTPFRGVRTMIVKRSLKQPGKYLLSMNKSNRKYFDLYMLDISSGDLMLKNKNPGNIISWIGNDDLKLPCVVIQQPGNNESLLCRASEDSDWKVVSSWSLEDHFKPIGFDKKNENIYVLDNIKKDRMTLSKINLTSGKAKIIVKPKKADLQRIIWDDKKSKPAAALEHYIQSKWYMLDKSYVKDFEVLSGIRDGNFLLGDRDRTDRKWMITYAVSDSPIHYYIYDRKTKKADLLFTHRPKLKKYKLSKNRPVTIKTRDGLEMVGYLTLPVGVRSKKLPLIIQPLDWIQERYSGDFDTISQLFANRGYAFLALNHRGAFGFGKAFLAAGDGQWGEKMLDDIEDAAKWAIKKKIADPKRIGLFGMFMGGFNNLALASSSSMKFQCSVSINPQINMLTLIKSLPPQVQLFMKLIEIKFGNLKDTNRLRKISPYYRVKKIKTPTLIANSKDNPFLSKGESLHFAKKLRANRTPVIYIEFPDDNVMYFNSPENSQAFFSIAEKFFAKYLGGRYEPYTDKELKRLKESIIVKKY